jgi:hypothetical protein
VVGLGILADRARTEASRPSTTLRRRRINIIAEVRGLAAAAQRAADARRTDAAAAAAAAAAASVAAAAFPRRSGMGATVAGSFCVAMLRLSLLEGFVPVVV